MEEASENPGFDLANIVASGPVEDGSSGYSNLQEKVHVSGDHISLYVESLIPECETLHETDDEVENHEEAGNANNVLAIDSEECKFAVGDVIWVKTKTKTKIWWPGKIHDPLDSSKYGVKTESKGCLLVRYLANSHVSWYHPSQLKPFYGDFLNMSKQNKSRGFVAAVEKAIDEFGIRLKSRLTSSISLQANGQPSNYDEISNMTSIIDDFGEISATLLNSRDFLSHLKNLALAAFKPRVLEPAILRSYLSAFYYSLRHLNFSTTFLQPMANAEAVTSGSGIDPSMESKNLSGNKVGSHKGIEDHKSEVVEEGPKRESKSRKKNRAEESVVKDGSDKKVEGLDGPITGEEGSGSSLGEKGSDFRARKKSKYLSYPYINLEGKESPVKVDDDLVRSTPVDKPSSKFQQKWLKILSDISAEELLSISSMEFLLGLHIAASGYSYPRKSENLERIEGFFYRFRSSSFQGDGCIEEMYSKNMVAEKEKRNEKAAELDEGRTVSGKKNSESPLATTEENGRKLQAGKLPCALLDGNIDIANPLHLPIKELQGLPDLNGDRDSAVRSDFRGQNVSPVLVGFAEGGHAKKKRKRRNKMAELRKAAESPALIPDLNRIQTSAHPVGKETWAPSLVPAQVDLGRRRRRKIQGTPIILTFSQGNPLPQKEVLEVEFSKFGTLKEVVASSLDDPNVAHVVFERKSDANKARRSLEKGFPFGGALVKYELQVSAPSKALQNLTMRTAPFTNGALINSYLKPVAPTAHIVDPPAPTPGPALAPPLNHIKENLEMMTSMLKQSGDSLSPETRTKLELEIKGLLSKVSTMVCSSSSS